MERRRIRTFGIGLLRLLRTTRHPKPKHDSHDQSIDCFESSKGRKGSYLAVPGSQDAQREVDRKGEGSAKRAAVRATAYDQDSKGFSTRHAPDV